MKNYRKTTNEIRNDITREIIAIFNKHKCESVGCFINDVPILREDLYDSNLTFTLDAIGVRFGDVYFEGSSSVDETTMWASSLDIELLIGIYEWLIENEDELFEIYEW